ncbi:DUF4132 domain-containing protein [Paenibacillus hunanensis]|uniref:DUF4132 domain-containing protein n=1 Tax=Paenibacillus hunanensis TaxID=539262 RepID=UPI0020268CB4|nr:DUF4132 domain-containing protein [Paenibacillus hunanensis]MCL9660907.1 DUF4132 domain-containing protein [Paenibacillus hunanensis]
MASWYEMTVEVKERFTEINSTLQGDEKEIAELCTRLIQPVYVYNDEAFGKLTSKLEAMSSENGISFFEPLMSVIEHLAGEVAVAHFRYMIDSATEYPYSVGYARRPYHTSNLDLHKPRLIEKMCSLLRLYGKGFDLHEYLKRPDYDWRYSSNESAVPSLIAQALDQNDETTYTLLMDIIQGENQNALLERAMLKGMLMSHRPECYQAVADLLLAARLQEGLRQTIAELMDEGTIEAMRVLLSTIIEHDLVRYSSIVRALDVWTGMNLEASQQRVAKQLVQYIHDALQDESIRTQWLSSEDANQIFISLWATAVHEENDLPARIQQVIDSGVRYRKLVALYVLANSQYMELRFGVARKLLHEQELNPATDPELMYGVMANYVYGCEFTWDFVNDAIDSERVLRIPRTPQLEDAAERERDFARIRALLSQMPSAELSGTSNILAFSGYHLRTDDLIDKLIYLARYGEDSVRLSQVLDMKDQMSPDLRGRILEHVISDGENTAQRRFVLDALADKSMSNREKAIHCASKFTLNDEEIQRLEDLFRLKTGSLRQSAIRLLLNQPEDRLELVTPRLLSSKNELQRLAGLELLTELQSLPPRQEQFARLVQATDSFTKPTAKEQVLLDKLHSEDEKYTENNGFGLYDPAHEEDWLKEPVDTGDFDIATDLLTMKPERISSILQDLNDLVYEHRNVEYQVHYANGYKVDTLIGGSLQRTHPNYNEDTNPDAQNELDDFPLAEVWRGYFDKVKLTAMEYLQLRFYLQLESMQSTINELSYFWYTRSNFEDNEKLLDGWRKDYIGSVYPLDWIIEIQQTRDKLLYKNHINSLLFAISSEVEEDHSSFHMINLAIHKLLQSFPKDKLEKEYAILNLLINPWVNGLHEREVDDEQFRERFRTLYEIERVSAELAYPLNGSNSLADYARAHVMGIVHDESIYRLIMHGPEKNRYMMHELTTMYAKNNIVDRFPNLKPVREKMLARILEIELARGELPTPVSNLASKIERFYGMKYFVSFLNNLQKETFVRGYIYSYSGSLTKKEMFSLLLKNCYPLEGEDEQLLDEMLQSQPLSDQRLLEAAMYAPQWIEIIAKHLNWKGLRSAAWYFHAHINETFSAEKETIVAHYSPITPQQFNDGAFDLNWFLQAYDELGAERFAILYDCAKYISGGANHRRSQLFADAVLGKLELEKTQKQVADKRTKDQLLAYSLIPLASGEARDTDLRERYEFIQLFLKQSKAFGAQRRASESTAAAIALDNLARNAGYADVTRLTWDLEARKLDELLFYFNDYEVEPGLLVRLDIDNEGQTSVLASKDGKLLKSVPSRLNKDEYIVKLKELKTDLRDQYKRARQELERSMINETALRAEEIMKLLNNPVLAPLFKSLVFRKVADGSLGYLSEDGMSLNTAFAPEPTTLQATDEVNVAHPIHLFESGQWQAFQSNALERQFYAQQADRADQVRREPFKQVFRELYLPNADEKASGIISRRYAGHQVQPSKTSALLRGRGWTVSYEEGLQKVDYKHNLIASIYALADWFSPADTEAPTLETVQFHDRSTYKPIPLEDVPPIVFSEVMRDLDLVVSVAHVGGVDPEASLTTIELRRVIVEETTRLLKLDNVKIDRNHAMIQGKLGEYNVHLGSAIVHKQTVGAIHIVPVHSQHRGRLFLPFLDEDPRTAEIVSKILLLAEDQKIKDPQILEQLRQ